jgi:hypothetical protein
MQPYSIRESNIGHGRGSLSKMGSPDPTLAHWPSER